ncbi:MAG TPA: acyl-CoA dehydrogenase family protein, partial [Thermoanaerobaculia bacterium]|nr:acyl-CoA dehydrogenase family protein [Thermoanaerobaculia bacterium]
MRHPSDHEPTLELESAPADRRAQHVAPDCRGADFWELDASLRSLLPLYLAPALLAHLEPALRRLGVLAGGRLDELAAAADRNPPVLHARDRWGRDREWIEYHPAYREMEALAFGELGLHAMTHRGGVLGWPEPLPAVAKYAFQYLFVQAEFGLLCPVSVTDTSIHLIRRFGSEDLQARLLPRMLSQDLDTIWKGTQFITERAGGSDVGAVESIAVRDGDRWRLHGEKWFCSHADADLALLLARPRGAPAGTAGLTLFAMPRHLEDGERNAYRIVRLKDKLGTRSMASGEIVLEGAQAWLVGDQRRGFRQMMEQVNLSRLSHGVRAAAMMRRCWNEARAAARGRRAFGRRLDQMAMVRRQLLEILVPAEQALSMSLYAAAAMDAAGAGDCDEAARDGAASAPQEEAAALRILTPLLKLRACRDNIQVATAAMEVRGGNGYIEEWVNARLVRDAHIGVIWEGTSNIVALDVVARAAAKEGAHRVLARALHRRLDAATAAPSELSAAARSSLDRAVALVGRVGTEGGLEVQASRAASALYHAASAALLVWEGARLGGEAGA